MTNESHCLKAIPILGNVILNIRRFTHSIRYNIIWLQSRIIPCFLAPEPSIYLKDTFYFFSCFGKYKPG